MHHRVSVPMLAACAAIVLATYAPALGEDAAKSKPAKTANKSNAQDAITVGPSIYRVILENDRVRVLEARFLPGASIGSHMHPDHVVVVVSAGKLSITNAEGTREIDAKVGDTLFMPAETHSARNVGTTEFVCVVTELKGKYKTKGQASPPPGTVDVQQGKVDG
ncbi:MAG TPA: cupin domain-containing protein [Candidatus Krumholzibacteria bacterium]|nr:cupin domain-containing protein [Candidatus Krumholzibacteria bacterium]